MTTIADRHEAILITLRKDGTPQSSNVMYALLDGAAKISVTADRAKTRNLQRDPRCVLHVLGGTFWEYASIEAAASLSEVTVTPGDDAGRELLAVYEAVSGKAHPDPDEFFAAMVADKRLVVRLALGRATGPLAE
ncbi:MAG: class F420-dependent enzyme [Frankiales bacterium]|nr:class F420-dependent enzyme [Frankiales bacterium]